MGDLVKKTKIVPFMNTGTDSNPVWTRIKKSTSFDLGTNPQVKTFDFISSEQPEEEIDAYQPSLSQALTMFKGEPDYQHIFDMLFELPTGAEAHRDVLIVFYQETATYTPESASEAEEVYKAWKTDSLVKINQLDSVNEQISFDLSFNNIKRGAVAMVDGNPEFTEGTFKNGSFTPKA
ncbi:MAG: hypothetical protein MJ196_06100 [Treponemataceae bacterium]|nr:hypothetical protein [Treponemataceae bacterium]